MTTEPLKPCPFCGGTQIDGKLPHRFACQCGVSARNWNTRHGVTLDRETVRGLLEWLELLEYECVNVAGRSDAKQILVDDIDKLREAME